MQSIVARIRAGEILVGDGAMGTFLQAKGLRPGECPELWCLERPDEVRDIHRRYRAAGSDIAESNSFGANRYKLRRFGLEERVAEINRAAAALAREVAGSAGYVLGSMGPTGEFMEPYGTETEQAFYDVFREQAVALEEGGADAAIVETMTALEEAGAAVRAVKESTHLAVMVSLTFDPQADGGYATLMGVRPEQFAAAAVRMGADVAGANCGTGPGPMVEVVKRLRAAVDLPLLAMPNAGVPVLEKGRTVFKATPAEMGARARDLAAAGARIIGGCCGTGPEHIAAMKRALAGS